MDPATEPAAAVAADVRKRATDGNTALTIACGGHNSAYNLNIVRQLLRAVIDAEACMRRQRGSIVGKSDVTVHALQAHNEWSARVDMGRALDVARKKGHTSIVALVEETLTGFDELVAKALLSTPSWQSLRFQ